MAMRGREGKAKRWFWAAWLIASLLLFASSVQAQVEYPLNSTGVMQVTLNGEFAVAEDDLRVKVPGGHVRINRDFDGVQWTLNRQWSGLHTPGAARPFYASVGSYMTCTIYDGINSCDAGSGVKSVVPGLADLLKNRASMRVLNDLDFNGGQTPEELPAFVTRKGVGFTLGTDRTSYGSNDHPRFIVRPQSVLKLPDSSGPDAHPAQAPPRSAATTERGFRWTDRSGQWIEYDNQGRIVSYGDRNDVRVWFQYGAHGQIERVLDDNGRTVFTLLYTDADAEYVSEVRDHTPLDGSVRRVRYEYDDDQLVRVIDARGNTTHFEYSGAKLSKVVDAAGRATTVHYNAPPIPRAAYRAVAGGGGGGGGGTVRRAAVSGDGLRGEQQRRLSKIVAPDGGETEIQYDYDRLKKEFSMTVRHPETPSGRRVEHVKVDIDGRLVSHEVNGNVLLSSTGSRKNATYTDERGAQTTVRRDAFDEITSKTLPDGSQITIAYEAGSLDIRQVMDEAGTVTRAAYDSRGNLVRLETPAGRPEQNVLHLQVNSRGEPTRVIREGGANPVGGTDPDVELQLGYDINGNLITLIDGEGHTWAYNYDAQGNLVSATDPLGHAWSYGYDAHGNQTSVTDPNGLTSRYSYDATGRPIDATNARDQTAKAGYDPAGRLETLTDALGAVERNSYDAAGRLVSTIDALNQRMQAGYDAQGRLRNLTDGESNVITFGHADVDGVDRGSVLVSSVQYPTMRQTLRYNNRQGLTRLDEVVGRTTRTTTMAYDTRGLLTSLVDANDGNYGNEYDLLGRPSIGTDPLGSKVTLTYNRHGNLIQLVDERGHNITLEYDRRDLLVKETNPLGQSTQYSYDAAGRLQELLRASGARLTFVFDPGGRLVSRSSYAPDGSLEFADSFSWDEANRLTGWSTQGATGVRSYDNADRMLSETVTIDGVSLTRTYTYYPNGQIRTLTGPDGITLTYIYNVSGELAGVQIPGEGTMSVAEWTWTEAARVVLPGGTVQEIERDGALNPLRLRVKSPNQVTLFDQQSAYGNLDEVLSRSTQGLTVDYSYDPALRLTRAQPSVGQTETFTLDASGNRIRDHQVSSDWLYDAANRLIQRGSVIYQYDSAGNLVQKTDSSLPEPQRVTRYAYDGYNRIKEVRNGSGELIARYTYDPFGYRLSKEVTAYGADAGGVEGKRLFLQSEIGLLAETDDVGTVLQAYGWQPEGAYSASPLFLRTTDGYFYYHNDPLGQPWQMTNKAGAVVWQAARTQAFGRIVIAAGAQVVQPWRLPGQYLDEETGLHYNLHRYYDPEVGRYISEDPAGYVDGLNLYLYGAGSPTHYIDPYGLWVQKPNTGSWLADNTFGWAYVLTNGAPVPQQVVDFAAGAGDMVSFGATNKIRGMMGTNDAVDQCSGAYLGGGFAMAMGVPIGRLGYVYQASRIPKVAQSARQAHSMRNMLKWQYRGPLAPFLGTWHMRSYLSLIAAKKTEAQIIAGAGRTNAVWTAGMVGGGTAVAAGRTTMTAGGCECGN